jgi:cytochrome c
MEYLVDASAYLSEKAGKKVTSKMTFKLKKEDDREDVIAYLHTQK